MKKIFNKLVRDNIPDIIEKDNHTAVVRLLDDDEFTVELKKKLIEESQEIVEAESKSEVIKEVLDVYEVLRALCDVCNIDWKEVEKMADKRRLERGGFEKKIYLVLTEPK